MKPRTIKIIYWAITILFGLFMLFSGVSELMQNPAAQELLSMLGYPLYLNTMLGIAKILGVIALLQPKFTTLKEWAYAGFTIDILGASLSFALNGNGAMEIFFPLIFLVVLLVSYALWKKSSA